MDYGKFEDFHTSRGLKYKSISKKIINEKIHVYRDLVIVVLTAMLGPEGVYGQRKV